MFAREGGKVDGSEGWRADLTLEKSCGDWSAVESVFVFEGNG